jgi:hypothetical protein
MLLALPAFFVTFDHAFPFGSLTFGTFFVIAAWLELAPGSASSCRQPRRVSGTAATKNLRRDHD